MTARSRYDAGDLGCGDGLPRELRRHVGEVPVGGILEVTVRDPAAKADLPPLVRMMGHRILSEEAHPDGRLVIEVERGA
jgi:TusA-related sulfurtransferase